jgi:hypothetical protein
MGQLYEKMSSDLKLRRYSTRTQKSYLWYARRFVRHFTRSPADMGMQEIGEFLRSYDERHASTLGQGEVIRLPYAFQTFAVSVVPKPNHSG